MGIKLPSISKGSSKEVKEDPTKLKEVKNFAILCKKAVNLPSEFTPSSSSSHPVFVTLLQQNVMVQNSDGPYINQA